jgi:hypothetical protein
VKAGKPRWRRSLRSADFVQGGRWSAGWPRWRLRCARDSAPPRYSMIYFILFYFIFVYFILFSFSIIYFLFRLFLEAGVFGGHAPGGL